MNGNRCIWLKKNKKKHGAKATEFLFMLGSNGNFYDRNNKISI